MSEFIMTVGLVSALGFSFFANVRLFNKLEAQQRRNTQKAEELSWYQGYELQQRKKMFTNG